MEINLEQLQVWSKPYKFAKATDFIVEEQADLALNWLCKNAPWHLTETDFYSQYEFLLSEGNVPQGCLFLISKETKQKLKKLVEKQFGCHLKDDIDVVAHRLSNRQAIGIHNDYIDQKDVDFEVESHRLLIQLNTGWKESNGGLLEVFNSDDIEDKFCSVIPYHRSMFMFEISSDSHHAVTETLIGERYTLIYNFYRK